jgi:hypothetical protein
MNKLRNRERGVALIVALLALFLVTAIAFGLTLQATTETSINFNYRDEQVALFASKAGIEEARDRMIRSNANPITLPTVLPGGTGGSYAAYISAPGVLPWSSSDPYQDTEFPKELGTAPSGSWYNSTATVSSYSSATNPLPYRWVRVNLKVNSSAYTTGGAYLVDGNSSNSAKQVCYDTSSGHEVVVASGGCWGFQSNVYEITSYAVTASGSRRMLQMEVTPSPLVPVQSAIYTKGSLTTSDALNVTGYTDPVCAAPSVAGAVSGSSTAKQPGPGNVSGSPDIKSYAGWPYNLPKIVSTFQSAATPLPATGTGVTALGTTPPSYSGPHATLGVAPTVTYDASGAIASITSPGTPAIYSSPGDLTLGTSTIGGAPVTGQGILLVNGNLTMDVTNGFNFYGLIVVTGNITIVAANNNVNPHIHGAILGGGTFSAPISSFGGSISIHQNACMVQSALANLPVTNLSSRELMF